MGKLHLTRDLLRAVADGEISPRHLAQLGLEHLMELCPHCREEILAWRRERARPATDYDRAFENLPLALERDLPLLQADRRRAAEDFRELLKLQPAQRLARIERARTRFGGSALAERLIAESRARIPASPREAFHLADLTLAVLRKPPNTTGAIDLAARATAHLANAARAMGELRRADEHFSRVRRLIEHHGITDAEILAEVDSFEGSLRKDQRRFDEAEGLLTRAIDHFREIGDSREVAGTLLKLGDLYYHQGLLERALDTARTTLESLQRQAEQRLLLCARHNLALYLTEAERFEEAAAILEADLELYSQFPVPWSQLRLSWLRGKIAAGLGDVHRAEVALKKAREGFIREGIGYDTAMVSLDLALLYLREERTTELQRLAEETLPIFQAHQVHREATAAFILLQEAARREVLTPLLLEGLTT